MTLTIPDTDKIFQDLSDIQRDAASYLDGPLAIIAGPGSGKTRVMSHRMAYILATGVPPWRALGITFTNKAAGELKERCQTLASQFTPHAGEVHVSTFHSFGARFLRRHHEYAELRNSQFSIYDREDQASMLKLIIEAMDADLKPNKVISVISNAKSKNLSPKEFAERDTSHKTDIYFDLYQQYQNNLKEANAVDFDDLLLKPYQILLDDQQIREHYQDRYLHIMVDEFQDTNHLQFEIIRLLGDLHRNVCIVGDPDQSIYSWRGAKPDNMRLFTETIQSKDGQKCKTFDLGESYRSPKNLIDAANALISHNKERFERTLYTKNKNAGKIEIIAAKDTDHEATIVLDKIQRNIGISSRSGEEITPGKIAVLYRANAQSRAIETECSRRGVPYKLIGGTRFYDRREIKDALAMLRIVNNPTDEISLRRIINVPPRGIGPSTLNTIERYSHFQDMSLLEATLTASDPIASVSLQLGKAALTRVQKFAEFVNTLITNSLTLHPLDLLEYTLKASGYLDWINRDEATRLERKENLNELMNVALKFSDPNAEPDPRQALADFLEHAALFANVDDLDDQQPAVTLITLHQSKGLEFDTVFIIGAIEGTLPHRMALDVSDLERYEAALQEERRLMYVGITRDEETLYITYPRLRSTSQLAYGENKPSRFIKEISHKYDDECKKHNCIEQRGVDYINDTRSTPVEQPVSSSYSHDQDPPYRARLTTIRHDKPRRKFTEDGIDQLPNDLQFKAGQRVRHHTFGTGVVVNARPIGQDIRITVAFKEAGVRTLVADMANLEKI